ncbi:hypothetical protein SH668x_003189 [Planctomicrobium sp. SH668]|uniref:hypothetical protein n=1 Tax=Planctomicrobium sp. SH668 TaxID=3448126 RepID=UPI003F5B1FD9
MAVIEKPKPDAAQGSYVDFDEFIEYQLKKTRTGIHSTDLISAGVVLLSFLSAYLLVFAIVDQWVIPHGLSDSARLLLLSALGLIALGWVGWKILYPWMQSINTLYAARQIEAAHPELKGSLLSWVNLRQAGHEISPSILSALEKRTAHEMSNANLEQAVDRKSLMRGSYVLFSIIVVLCLYTFFSPKNMSTTLWRALMPASSVSAATQTEIRNVKPGTTEVLARDHVQVVAELGGKIPEVVNLLFSTADRRFVNEPIRMQRTDEEIPRFQATLTGDGGKGLMSDVTYRIEAGDARSATYEIRVNQPPSAEVIEVVYEYPRYMRLDPSTQPGNTIEAWEGTFVTVRARANMPVKKGAVFCTEDETATESAEEYPMVIRDDVLTARWQLRFRDDGTFARYYHVQVWNERNQKNRAPTIYRIQIKPDLKPEITIVNPTEEITAPANIHIPIALNARDPDFMLRRVSLKLAHNGEELAYPAPLFMAPPEKDEFKSVYRLKLNEIPLKAGDQIEYWAEAEDNFEPFGKRLKNITRTQRQVIKIVEPVAPEQAENENQKQEKNLDEKIQQADQNDQRQDQPNKQQPQDHDQQGQKEPRQEGGEQNSEQMQDQADQNQQGEQPMNGANENQQKGGETSENAGNGDQQNSQPGENSRQGKGADGNTPEPNPEQMPNDQKQPGEQQSGESAGKEGDSRNGTQSQPSPNQKGSDGESSKQNGEGEQSGKPSSQNQKSTQKPKQDKAAEDQALKELLEWEEKNQQQSDEEKSQQGMNRSDGGDQSKPESSQNEPSANQQGGENRSSDSENAQSENGDQNDQSPSDSPMSPSQNSKQKPMTDQSGTDQEQKSNGEPSDQNNTGPDSESMPADENGENKNQPQNGNPPKSNGEPSTGKNTKNATPQQGEQPSSPGETATPSDSEDGSHGDASGQENGNGSNMKPAPNDSSKPKNNSAEKGNNDSSSGKPDANQMESGKEGRPGETGEQQGEGNRETQKTGQPDGKPMKEGNDASKPAPDQGETTRSQGENSSDPEQMPEKGEGESRGESAGQSEERGNPPNPNAQGNGAEQEAKENQGMKGQESQQGKPQNPQNPSGNEQQSGSDSEGAEGSQQGMEDQPGKEGPGKEGPGKEGSGKEGSGKEGSGKEGSGKEGSGKEGSGKEGSGKEGSGKEGSGKEGSGKEGSGKEGSGKEGSGKEGGGQEGGGQEGGESGAQSSDGSPSGKPGSNRQSGVSNGMQRPVGDDNASGSPSGDSGDLTPEEANLANKKKATELALKRLRNQMERGETPNELMDRLGYTEKDLDQFMQRLEQQLGDQGADQSPESAASRRQFETLLKGIDYQSSGQSKAGGTHERKASGSSGSSNRLAPPQYRRNTEAYKEMLNRQGTQKP